MVATKTKEQWVPRRRAAILTRYTREEIAALPEAVTLEEIRRARGIGEVAARKAIRDSMRVEEDGRKVAMVYGVPVEKIGSAWMGTKDDLLASMSPRRSA